MSRRRLTREAVDYLQCTICIATVCRPRIIPCGHSFCEACLKNYLEKKASERRRVVGMEITCPVCRNTIQEPAKGLRVEDWATLFPLNHLVISLLEEQADRIDRPHCLVHAEKSIKYFCQDHFEFFCSKCLLESHRNCQVNDMQETNLKSLNESVKEKVKAMKKSCEQHVSDLTDGINKVCADSESIVEQVRGFQSDVEKRVNDFVERVTASVKNARQTTVLDLNGKRESNRNHLQELKHIVSIIEDTDSSENLEKLITVVNYNRQLLIVMKSLVGNTCCIPTSISWNCASLCEEVVKHIEKMTNDISVEIQTIEDHTLPVKSNSDKDEHSITETKKVFENNSTEKSTTKSVEASIEVVHHDVEFMCSMSSDHSLTAVKEQPLWFQRAHYLDMITIEKRGKDFYDPDITACMVIPDRRILLADHNNNKLRVLVPTQKGSNESSIYKQTQERIFKGRPWGIACLASDASMIAVTFPFARVIVLLNIDDQHVAPVKIRTSEKCYGIASLNTCYVITTFDDGHFVIFLTTNGDEQCRVALGDNGNPTMLNPVHVTAPEYGQAGEVLVCCHGDWRIHGCVVVMNTQGDIIKTYQDSLMQQCDGCDLDADGNVYVCDYKSSSVHVFASDGGANKIILSREHRINQPSHIRFLRKGKTLVVSEAQNIKFYLLVPL